METLQQKNKDIYTHQVKMSKNADRWGHCEMVEIRLLVGKIQVPLQQDEL